MGELIHLTFFQVILSFILVVVILLVLKVKSINIKKDILIYLIKIPIQLMLLGYILVFIFNNPSPTTTIIAVLLIELFALHTIFKKFKGKLFSALKVIIVLSITVNTLICIFYLLFIVINIYPWYNPQYVIPLSFIIIINTMRAIILALKSLFKGMVKEKYKVEEALILGATPKMATRDIVNNSFNTAIKPIINSTFGMGLIFLPGNMLGLLLSGVSPLVAVGYQIIIMFVILGSVCLSVITLLHFGSLSFFNNKDQLKWI